MSAMYFISKSRNYDHEIEEARPFSLTLENLSSMVVKVFSLEGWSCKGTFGSEFVQCIYVFLTGVS